MTKPTKLPVRPAKTQISLGFRPVWSESSLYAEWVAKDTRFLHADSEDSDQTGRMPRLIRVFAGRTGHFVSFVMLWLGLWFTNKRYEITKKQGTHLFLSLSLPLPHEVVTMLNLTTQTWKQYIKLV